VAVKTSDDVGDDQAGVVAGKGGGGEGARRAITLLLAFSAERHTQSARDLARATGIPLPSVYRYVALLREMGLLTGDERGLYHLSARLSALARAAETAETLIDFADPVMRKLSAVTGETTILVRMIARSAVCVHRIESRHNLRTSYEPGQPLSLERGASARLLLAGMTPAARRDYLAPLAARDSEAAARLAEQAAIAGERGWAVSEEEIDTGVWAAAAAVRDRTGIVAALSVPSPLVRAPEALHDDLLAKVRAAAEAINAALRAAHRLHSPQQGEEFFIGLVSGAIYTRN
jgi:DNA-binding IclR family transcriptional regulator